MSLGRERALPGSCVRPLSTRRRGFSVDVVRQGAMALGELLRASMGPLQQWIADPLVGDASYRAGFMWGVAVALVVGVLARSLSRLWNRVVRLFRPTRAPATTPGASPFHTCLAAVVAGLVLLLALLCITFLLFASARP